MSHSFRKLMRLICSVTLPTGLLIFQNIVSRGFWLSRWTENTAPIDRDTMIMHLAVGCSLRVARSWV